MLDFASNVVRKRLSALSSRGEVRYAIWRRTEMRKGKARKGAQVAHDLYEASPDTAELKGASVVLSRTLLRVNEPSQAKG